MNIEELKRDHPDLELHFSGYYKYVFTYVGTLPDGREVAVTSGGNADDIYREGYAPVETVSSIDVDYVEVRDA